MIDLIHFPKPTVEQFFRTNVITNFAVSDDERKLIFSSNLNGTMNLWAMDLPDTYAYLFAQVDESFRTIKIDKKNRFVVAEFDRDGDENYQLYALPKDGGMPQDLITGDPSEKYYLAHLSEDGERLYYCTSEKNPRFLNTHVRHITNGKDELLLEGEKAPTYLMGVSEDEKTFAYIQMFANTYSHIFIESNGKRHYLTPDPAQIHLSSSPLFIDEKLIYFTTNFDSEYMYLASYDMEKQAFSIVKKFTNESVSDMKVDAKKETLYITTEVGVTDHLYRYSIKEDSLEKLELPVDIVEKIHISKSNHIYLLGRSATIPFNIYRGLNGEDWTQLTNNRVLGVHAKDMVEPDIVTYQSFDGTEIEALLFRAKRENDNGYTIFWPHGGPQYAERKSFRSMFQAMLNQGYSIFAPNFRGSTGYGSSFVKLVERDWGHGPRLDCVAGIEWLFEQNISNKDKLFLVGGSYGGYMALLLHGRHTNYFKAVVDIFGVSNLFTFVKSVPDHWKPMMDKWVGDPVRDKERFIKDSPITYLDSMTKPMLVIQGAKDPRVVKEESDQIVEKLKEKGRDVEYLILEDEGHGFSKKENEIKVYQSMLEFLGKYQ